MFDEDYHLSLEARPYQNAIYRKLFGIDDKSIKRFEHDEHEILDAQYHIDVELTLPNGSILLGQEKALRHKFNGYDTFTIEFYQNRRTKEQGEFFNLGAQFYLHSYWNAGDKNGFCKWYLVKIFDFLAWLKTKTIEELESNTKPVETGNASFYYIGYYSIPDEFIYAKKTGHDIIRQLDFFSNARGEVST